MKEFKVRCSQLSKVMSNPKSKKDLLSATCISHVEEWLKEQRHGRRFQIDTAPIRKGNEKEVEAISLVNKILGLNLTKSNDTLFNDYMTGHIDLDYKAKKIVIDTKVCKDFSTFPLFQKEISNEYYWQGQGYMELMGYEQAWFIKCAITSPEYEIRGLIKRKWYQLIDIYGRESDDYFQSDYQDYIKEVFMRHVIDNSFKFEDYNLASFDLKEIPIEQRINITKVDRCQSDIDLIKPRVIEIREYLKGKVAIENVKEIIS